MTDTYVLAAFTVMQRKSIKYVERTSTDNIGKLVAWCLHEGADYISIRRIRNE